MLLLSTGIDGQKKIGFFVDGVINDGGFNTAAVSGLNKVVATYGTGVQVDYTGPGDGISFAALTAQ